MQDFSDLVCSGGNLKWYLQMKHSPEKHEVDKTGSCNSDNPVSVLNDDEKPTFSLYAKRYERPRNEMHKLKESL